ncbi:MAG TPA: PaaI family thioesterase [Acidimicrobiales bacterium]|nr:PaaI family thioesterase [Acidimicrobiales bacterium]
MDNGGFRETVGLEVVDGSGDQVQVVLEADERHVNPYGTVHGGALATLADVAMGTAAATGDNRPVTIEMKVTYLEAAQPGRLTATATVRRRGKRIIIVECDIDDADGSAVAHGIATFTVV